MTPDATDILGLRYGVVELAHHRSEWNGLFDAAAAQLRAALQPWSCEVEHVGSTAVPGLTAKPIIDIAVGVPGEDALQPVVARVEALGYQYRGDGGADGGHVLVRECTPLIRTHHVHVVGLQDVQWQNYLLLREYLRASPVAREAYARAKQRLATHHEEDRKAYTAGKAETIRKLLAEARNG